VDLDVLLLRHLLPRIISARLCVRGKRGRARRRVGYQPNPERER
jgi:hypothetical protein